MKIIPERTTKSLLIIMGYYAAILYALLLLCHAILRNAFTAQSLVALATLAVMAAVIAGIGFWLRGKLFFMIFSAGLAAGLLYMFYVVIFNSSPGWSDLTSIIGFIFIAVAGLVGGLAAELIRYLVRPKLKQE